MWLVVSYGVAAKPHLTFWSDPIQEGDRTGLLPIPSLLWEYVCCMFGAKLLSFFFQIKKKPHQNKKLEALIIKIKQLLHSTPPLGLDFPVCLSWKKIPIHFEDFVFPNFPNSNIKKKWSFFGSVSLYFGVFRNSLPFKHKTQPLVLPTQPVQLGKQKRLKMERLFSN